MAEDPGAIREAIEDTRREMADTIAELGKKADVKGQAAAKVDEVKANAVTAASAGAEQAKAVATDALHKVDAVIPEQVRPVVDKVVATATPRIDKGRSAVRDNPKPFEIGAGLFLVVLALRRRRRRRRSA
jgi:hypothetical protein